MLITQRNIDGISDVDVAHGTTRFLPLWKDIPKEFKRGVPEGTIYNRIVDRWYTGDALPEAGLSFNPGFTADAKLVKRFIMAHINCFASEYEHKMAGCAYLLSQIMTIKDSA
jgi:hypothetical protein